MYTRSKPSRWMCIWMMYTSLVSAQWVHHLDEKRTVDPASASLALFGALPSSLQAEALTNPAAAASDISSQFATGTPTWFTKLPPDVQTYFLTAADAAVPTAVVNSTSYSNGTTTTSAIKSTKLTSVSTASDTSISSATSTFQPPTATSTSSGLSIGAKAGIGASIPVAAIALAGCGVWLLMRRKRNQTPRQGEDFAESCGPVNGGHDADLPELVEQKGPGLASTMVQVRAAPNDFSYGSAEHVQELDSTNTTSQRTDGEVTRLEAEYATLQDRRQRLLELNRLDEEERRLKQQIGARQGQLGTRS